MTIMIRICQNHHESSLHLPLPLATVGEQNLPPENVSLWHADYFTLKTIRPKRLRKNI